MSGVAGFEFSVQGVWFTGQSFPTTAIEAALHAVPLCCESIVAFLDFFGRELLILTALS